MIELTPAQHARLRPLFTGFGSRLHGCIEAIFSGDFGRAWADDAASPIVGVAQIDFWFVAGDASSPVAADALQLLPVGGTIVTGGSEWDHRVRYAFGARLVARTRTGMTTPPPPAWDRARLQRFAATLPGGFAIERITPDNVTSFVDVASDFVHHFRTRDAYFAQGVGFGAFVGERCVAGCSSFTLAGGKLEIEIDTHPDFRRRGLARAVAATMILHCLDAGIEPCWDAHNPESAALALQLGFVDPQPYTVFVVTDGTGGGTA
jgi:GNAT superfamily N-acetyltransferase